MNVNKTTSLHGVYAGLREVEGRTDEPGNRMIISRNPGELGAADLLFEAATEVPQHGDRDDHPQQISSESVGQRPRHDAPDLARPTSSGISASRRARLVDGVP